MSKGQPFINGHNAGRYFVATADGKSVEPQESCYLPGAVAQDRRRPNELLLFDEHGKSPAKCRLVLRLMCIRPDEREGEALRRALSTFSRGSGDRS